MSEVAPTATWSISNWQVIHAKENIKKSQRSKSFCLRSWLFRKKGAHSPEVSREARLDLSPHPVLYSFSSLGACSSGNLKFYVSIKWGWRNSVAHWHHLYQRDPSGSSLQCPRQSRKVTFRITHRTCFLSIFTLELIAAAVLLQPQLQYLHKHSSWSLQIYHNELCALSDLYKKHLCPGRRIYISAFPGQPLQKGSETTGFGLRKTPTPLSQEF